MNRTLAAAALVTGLALAGCDSFDPLDKFQEWDIMGSSKTPLRGERRPVFPEGVPGVPQGVPPDMVKGYQPPAEEPPPVIQAKPAPQKQKKAAAPRKQQPRQQVQQEEPEPQMQQAPAARATTQPVQQGAGGWQTIPGAQPTWPADAQPAPRR
jgi:hypothetical protein